MVDIAPSCVRDSGVCPETAYRLFSCECVACQTLPSAFLITCDIKALCFRLVRPKCLLLWAEPSAGWALETQRLVVCDGSRPLSCCDVCFLCSVPIFSSRTANCRMLLVALDWGLNVRLFYLLFLNSSEGCLHFQASRIVENCCFET